MDRNVALFSLEPITHESNHRALVSIPFHQIMRSTTPLFAILIYKLFYSRTYSTSTYLSLIPLVLGVGLATYGDYYFTTLGFVLTLLGTILASVKTILTNRLMTGNLRLPAMEVLLRMSPLAAVQSIFFAWATGELGEFCESIEYGEVSRFTVLALLGNGMIAFALNVSSFQTNKLAGALTITVCGNVKQCLTILLGIVLFNVQVGLLNGFGMLLAISGAAWYSFVELRTKSLKPVESGSRHSSLSGLKDVVSPLHRAATNTWLLDWKSRRLVSAGSVREA
jgi:hypothetical protein